MTMAHIVIDLSLHIHFFYSSKGIDTHSQVALLYAVLTVDQHGFRFVVKASVVVSGKFIYSGSFQPISDEHDMLWKVVVIETLLELVARRLPHN